MAWHGVITDVGKTAIEAHLASGDGLDLDLVKTGTATVPAANMRQMTDVSALADTGSIIGKQGTQNGAEVQISVQASASRYVMKEIGLFATLEDESTVMIAYYNDDGIGVEVPAVADFPDFNYILFCLLDIINADDLTITMDMTHSVLISQIANNLSTASDTEGKVLDARQGKVLNDTKVNKTDIVDNLTTQDATKVLSAKQGYLLNSKITLNSLGTVSTLASLESKISTFVGGLSNGDIGIISAGNDTAFGLFTWTGTWVGTVQKLSPGRAIIRLYLNAALPGKDIVGYLKDSVFYWDAYALNSNIAKSSISLSDFISYDSTKYTITEFSATKIGTLSMFVTMCVTKANGNFLTIESIGTVSSTYRTRQTFVGVASKGLDYAMTADGSVTIYGGNATTNSAYLTAMYPLS